MSIVRAKNVTESFNKRSDSLKASAIASGMTIKKEWMVGDLKCFMAEQSQDTLKRGLAHTSECGACVNVNPRIWEAARGKIYDTVILPKRNAE